jgi:hypothetical protein
MDRAAFDFPLTIDVRDQLSELAFDELRYIIDAVRELHAGASPDRVETELRSFQRVRHLDPTLVHRIAAVISEDHRRP